MDVIAAAPPASAVAPVALTFIVGVPLGIGLVVNLGVLTAAAMLMHSLLADLRPAAADLTRVRFDRNVSPVESAQGKEASTWIVVASSESAFGESTPLWTDSFSNVISALR